IKNLYKKYGSQEVLNDLSVEFPKGKVISLIGGNGAGKSTLLGVVSKLVDQDEGNVYLTSKDIAEISNKDYATKVSFLRQSNFTHIRLTVEELISFGRFPYTRGKRMTDLDEQKVSEAIAFMELEDLADKYLDE